MKMRYQWFQDVPRNVSKREYRRYLNHLLGGGVSAFFAVGALAVAAGSWNLQDRVASTPELSIAQALQWQASDDSGPYRLAGTLTSDRPVTLPTADKTPLLFGSLTVTLSASKSRQKAERRTVFSWQENAASIVLSDGGQGLPLIVSPGELTPETQTKTAAVDTKTTTSSRIVPTAIHVDGLSIELDPDEYGDYDKDVGFTARAEIASVRSELPVLLIGHLTATSQGVAVQGIPGQALKIYVGGKTAVARQQSNARTLLPAFGLALLALAVYWLRKARRMRREFMVRSNQ